jgi:hypothetical protein
MTTYTQEQEPVVWPQLSKDMEYAAQDEFHILPPRMKRLWKRMQELYAAPSTIPEVIRAQEAVYHVCLEKWGAENGVTIDALLVLDHLKTAPSTSQPLTQKPIFWYRPTCGGEMYEGPVHDSSIGGKMMRDEKPGEWLPLFDGTTAPSTSQPSSGGAVAWSLTVGGEFKNCVEITHIEADARGRYERISRGGFGGLYTLHELFDHPAPSPSPVDMDVLIDQLTHTAACYHDYSSLRQRIADVVSAHMKGGE